MFRVPSSSSSPSFSSSSWFPVGSRGSLGPGGPLPWHPGRWGEGVRRGRAEFGLGSSSRARARTGSPSRQRERRREEEQEEGARPLESGGSGRRGDPRGARRRGDGGPGAAAAAPRCWPAGPGAPRLSPRPLEGRGDRGRGRRRGRGREGPGLRGTRAG